MEGEKSLVGGVVGTAKRAHQQDDEERKQGPSPPPQQTQSKKIKPTPNSHLNRFEFKFVSSRGRDDNDDDQYDGMFDESHLEGRLHMSLLVDSESGLLSLPQPDAADSGANEVNGWIKWPMIGTREDGDFRYIHTVEDQFIGRLQQNRLRLGYTSRKQSNASTRRIDIQKIDWSQVPAGTNVDHELVCNNVVPFLDQLGGTLVFHIKWGEEGSRRRMFAFRLYAVISEIRPGQSLDQIELAEETGEPKWDRLEGLVNKHPSTRKFTDKKGLIVEYRRFLALKLLKLKRNKTIDEDKQDGGDDDDEDGCDFVPSLKVDSIWHIHLVFPEQYQQDILAYAKQLKVDPFIVTHSPILGEKRWKGYEKTLRSIQDARLELIVGKPVDMEFWPEDDDPESSGSEISDDDSESSDSEISDCCCGALVPGPDPPRYRGFSSGPCG